MSTISLSPEEVGGYIGRSKEGQRRSRRRTVSTSFEQTSKHELCEERKIASYAGHITELLEDSEDHSDELHSTEKSKSLAKRIPCFGIMLVIISVIVFQAGSVLAKKMTIHPMMMLLYRDSLMITMTSPFTIAGGDNPFPQGKVMLVVIRGLAAGFQLGTHFYSIRYLPLSDVMMISSIKPVFNTILSCIFLKEACGVFEIFNLILTLSGIFLVVQPSFVFGDTGGQYDEHMMYTALALFVASAFSGVIGVILRYLRSMHWAALAITSKIFIILEMIIFCSFLSLFCVPECGLDRWGVFINAIIGLFCQTCSIISLKFEESHIVGLTANASSIIVSFVFQLIFFNDFPNTVKIVGACIVMMSMLLLGGHKIWRHRQIHQI